MNKSERISGKSVIIASKDPKISEKHANALKAIGFGIAAFAETGEEVQKLALKCAFDFIVADVNLLDGCFINTLLKIDGFDAKPAVIIADNEDLKNIEDVFQDHVMTYLTNPVSADDLQTSAYLILCRFEQFQNLKNENFKLRYQLETRKKLERAKGIIMVKYQFTEEDAYLKIRSLATPKRMDLATVCDFLIKSLVRD